MPIAFLYANSLFAAGLLSVVSICVIDLPVPVQAKALIFIFLAYLALICVGLAEALNRISRTDRFLVALVEHINKNRPESSGPSIYDLVMINMAREKEKSMPLSRKVIWSFFLLFNTVLFVYMWRALIA